MKSNFYRATKQLEKQRREQIRGTKQAIEKAKMDPNTSRIKLIELQGNLYALRRNKHFSGAYRFHADEPGETGLEQMLKQHGIPYDIVTGGKSTRIEIVKNEKEDAVQNKEEGR